MSAAHDYPVHHRLGGVMTTDPQPSDNPRNLAANLRHIANLIESANLGKLPMPASLHVSVNAYGMPDDQQKALIDLFSTVTGQEPTWDRESGTYAAYSTELKHGRTWSLASNSYIRRPDPAAELRAENERLRAELERQKQAHGETIDNVLADSWNRVADEFDAAAKAAE